MSLGWIKNSTYYVASLCDIFRNSLRVCRQFVAHISSLIHQTMASLLAEKCLVLVAKISYFLLLDRLPQVIHYSTEMCWRELARLVTALSIIMVSPCKYCQSGNRLIASVGQPSAWLTHWFESVFWQQQKHSIGFCSYDFFSSGITSAANYKSPVLPFSPRPWTFLFII